MKKGHWHHRNKKRISRNDYKPLHGNKLENLEVVDRYRFLDTQKLPKLSHENTENLNGPMTKIKSESVIKTFPTKKNPELDGFNAEFYQTFKKERILILLELLKTLEREQILYNSFYESIITVTAKPQKDTTKGTEI